LLFEVKVVEAEIVTESPGLVHTIQKEDYERVKHGEDTIPTDDFVEHARNAIK
jgi:hypothetical protein